MRTSRMLVLVVTAVTLTATGLSAASLASATALDVTGSLNPTSVTFDPVAVGATSAPQTVTLKNSGTDELDVSGPATIVGADPDFPSFKIAADNCKGATLAANETCTVDVVAHPIQPGAVSGTLDIPDNSTAGVEEATLQGTGTDVTHGLYYPVTTTRILDTRTGLGATKHPVTTGKTVQLQVLGKGHLPSAGASAVVLNLTVTHAASSGHITAYAGGTSIPTTSSINFPKGWTGANLVTVPIGANGKVNLYNTASSVDVIADVQGWYASSDTVGAGFGVGGAYYPQDTPVRLLDTRKNGGPLLGGYVTEVAAYYDSSMAASDIHALAITLTATDVTHTGYLTATDTTNNPTASSTLNLQPGTTTPNLAIVGVHPCTEPWCDAPGFTAMVFQVYNGSSSKVDFLVDLQGTYFSDTVSNLRYRSLTPTRIVDTRIPRGTTKLGPATTRVVTPPVSVDNDDTLAMSANFTAVSPTSSTYLEIWPYVPGAKRPVGSNLNPKALQTVASGVLIGVGPTNQFAMYNASGTTNALVDVSGSFDIFPSVSTWDSPAVSGAQVRSQAAANRSAVDRSVAQLGAVKGGAPAARPLSAK